MNNTWIDPILLHIGPLQLHWYGLMYAITFIIAYLFLQHSKQGKNLKLNERQKDWLLIVAILSIIIGGRIGYILFYNLPYYLHNPVKMFYIWEGGLSFHGGLILTIFGIYLFAKHFKISFLKLSDLASIIAPIGIFFGRIGNFINGELYGRIATSFCLHFPTDPTNCRYPSEIFEALGEGVLIYILLYLIWKKHPKPGYMSAAFLMFYGIIRFNLEFFRQPDIQIGLFWNMISLGQILSILTFLLGIVIFLLLRKSSKTIKSKAL